MDNDELWDVFVSHAREDKEGFVRPLVEALQKSGMRVWLDELTMTMGDSLRRRIDEGLAKSRYGVVVLSHAFFAKRWTQMELDSLVARENGSEKVILPVWHGVTAEDVRRHSPLLATRLAAITDRGVDHVVSEIRRATAWGLPVTVSDAAPQMSPSRPVPQDASRCVLLADTYQALGSSGAVHFLETWLSADQSKDGYHQGQFGLKADSLEESTYQTLGEPIDIKPRLYHTGWACFILSRHGLAPTELALAADAVGQLLRHQGTIRVAQGAVIGMSPSARRLSVTSFRHTIRAAQILLVLRKHHGLLLDVVGRMLDVRLGWQNTDGGWRQTDQPPSTSDLYASVYAAGLLDQWLATREPTQRTDGGQHAVRALQETLNYLEACWREVHWAYGGATAAQNIPAVFPEVATVLHQRAPELFAEITDWLLAWLTPTCTLTPTYFDDCRELSESSALVRFAYSLHMAGQPVSCWANLLQSSIAKFDAGQYIGSVDAAFLLDLIIAREMPPKTC